MRLVVVAFVLAVGAVPGAAGDGRHDADVDVVVPVVPEEHERLHYFDGQPHHLVPGTVTINKAPYVCDLDGKRFKKRDDFTAHLRTRHRVPVEVIPDRLLVRDGVVHYIGD